jgi:imidazolonepropionase
MPNTLIKNIKQLIQVRPQNHLLLKGKDMAVLPVIENAFLTFDQGIITSYGDMSNCPKEEIFDEVIDAKGKLVLPTWVDSHTHLVFAKNRADEFVDRIKGLSYEEIANKGGGILNSAKKLNEISVDQLFEDAKQRLENLIKQGTGAIEIKSGYGLTLAGERKMLRVIKRLKQAFDIPIKATFLGAHAFPIEFRQNQEGYIKEIIEVMLPAITEEKLVDYVDVFLETNYFNNEQTAKILQAAQKYGLKAKIHVNQFTAIGGIKTAVDHQALTVDHLEVVSPDDIEILKKSNTIPVALPSCSFFIQIPYTPARELINYGLPLALASDFNPGTTPSGNMHFVVALACIQMKMTPEEAINAATLNAAYAMEVHQEVGSITTGKKANLILTKPLDSFNDIPYFFGDHLIEKVFINGEIF